MKLRVSLLVAVLALCISPLRSQELGVIEFPTSGSPAAQPLFIKGVLLMHSFEYDDAREAFVEAEKAEPGFAMAYWGEAYDSSITRSRQQTLAGPRQSGAR